MRIVQLRKSVRSLLLREGRDRRQECQAVEPTARRSVETVEALCELAERATDLGATATSAGLSREAANTEASATTRADTAPASIDYITALRAFEDQEFEEAIFILERLPLDEACQRLLLNICRCQTGRKAEAQVDLYQWRHEDDFADGGRVLLALLLQAEGDVEAAERLIQERDGLETASGEASFLRILNLLQHGFVHDARKLARKFGSHRSALQRLGLIEGTAADFDMVGRLTDELIENEDILKSLCIGLRCQGDRGELMLLAHAIERALPKLSDRSVAIECIGELYLTAKRYRDARLWILRGIRDFPCAPGLLLLLLRLPDESVAPISTSTLTVSARVNPTNPVRIELPTTDHESEDADQVQVHSAPRGRRPAERPAGRVA